MTSSSFLAALGHSAEKTAIDLFGSAAFGSHLWSDVKQFVADIDGQTGLTGAQKKAKVLADLKIIFADDLGPALGDLFLGVLETAVQLGWMYLRAHI